MRTFADQWAPDGVMEFPFAPPGYQVLRSRDDVWDYSSRIRVDEVVERRRHHALDPDTVILEFSAKGAMLQTADDYQMDYIAVITTTPEGIHRRGRPAGGVRRVVQLSSSAVARGEPALGEIHDLGAGRFADFTVLRPSWFMQNFIGDSPLAECIVSEVLGEPARHVEPHHRRTGSATRRRRSRGSVRRRTGLTG